MQFFIAIVQLRMTEADSEYRESRKVSTVDWKTGSQAEMMAASNSGYSPLEGEGMGFLISCSK